MTITPSNDPPTADADSLTLAEDAAATAVPVLVGDVDIDGDTLTHHRPRRTGRRPVAITGGGTGLTYKPNLNATAADSFTYTLAPGHLVRPPRSTHRHPGRRRPVRGRRGPTVAEDSASDRRHVLASDGHVDGGASSRPDQRHQGVVAITGGGTGLTYKPYLSSQRSGLAHLHDLRRPRRDRDTGPVRHDHRCQRLRPERR